MESKSLKISKMDSLELRNLLLTTENLQYKLDALDAEYRRTLEEMNKKIQDLIKPEGKKLEDVLSFNFDNGEITFKEEVPVSGSLTKVQKAVKKR